MTFNEGDKIRVVAVHGGYACVGDTGVIVTKNYSWKNDKDKKLYSAESQYYTFEKINNVWKGKVR